MKTPTYEYAPNPTSARVPRHNGYPPEIWLTPHPALQQGTIPDKTPAFALPQGHIGGGVPGGARYTLATDPTSRPMATPRIHGMDRNREPQDQPSRRTHREDLGPHQAGANHPGGRESFPTGSTPLVSQAGQARQATREGTVSRGEDLGARAPLSSQLGLSRPAAGVGPVSGSTPYPHRANTPAQLTSDSVRHHTAQFNLQATPLQKAADIRKWEERQKSTLAQRREDSMVERDRGSPGFIGRGQGPRGPLADSYRIT